MFATIAMFFSTLTNIFSSINRLAIATDHIAETAEQRASAFKAEQSEINTQRLAYLKAKQAHTEANPEQFEF